MNARVLLAVCLLFCLVVPCALPSRASAGTYYINQIMDNPSHVYLDIHHFNKDKVRLGFFYRPESVETRKIFPAFLDLADQARQQGVEIIPYALGSSKVAMVYLSEAPKWFDRQMVNKRVLDRVIEKLRASGHQIGDDFATPYLFVVGQNNEILKEWFCMESVDAVLSVLATAGVEVSPESLAASTVGRDFSQSLLEMQFVEKLTERKIRGEIANLFTQEYFELYRLTGGSFRTTLITEQNQREYCESVDMVRAVRGCEKLYAYSMEDKDNQRNFRAFYCVQEGQVEPLGCFYEYAPTRWQTVEKDKLNSYYRQTW